MTSPTEKLSFVEVVAPRQDWEDSFLRAAREIQSVLQDNCIAIHHIGSTAIPNIYAKPIVDILPVVKNLNLVDELNTKFEQLGYICMGEYGIPGRRFYWKSQTKRTHNVHLFQQDSPEVARHLAFKEFMLNQPDNAQAYSFIKRHLAEVFPTDLENYMNGKDSFIQTIDYQTGHAQPSQLSAEDNIVIVPYNPAWPKFAEAEIKTIKAVTQLPYVAIEHFGSTAVPELSSKPIIDILITVKNIADAMQWVKPLETLGYIFWAEDPNKTHLRFFKGMPPYSKRRTHHIHIIEAPNFNHRILFRDLLRRDAEVRRNYEALKLQLAITCATDRELYTESKSEFIKKALKNI